MDYYPLMSKERVLDRILHTEQYYIKKYILALRSEEYYTFVRPNRLFKYWYYRKKNKLGVKLGFFISAGCFDVGLKIYHYGSIIVNPKSHIGKNCTIHGNCSIGSKGNFPDDSPTIGDNVDIGQNAQILGGITIANGSRIGAGAVVVKDITEENGIVIGIPGRTYRKSYQ